LFVRKHDPIDTYLLTRFIAGEALGALNEIAGECVSETPAVTRLREVCRELLPLRLRELELWWRP
ncbi:MAG TPA: hypothetical protein VKT80_00060, partial [Chloroflexota bacterium]|nr:hypothetical protein [Chloroflexota bacterium]